MAHSWSLIARARKGNNRIPSIHFQVQFVSFRESILKTNEKHTTCSSLVEHVSTYHEFQEIFWRNWSYFLKSWGSLKVKQISVGLWLGRSYYWNPSHRIHGTNGVYLPTWNPQKSTIHVGLIFHFYGSYMGMINVVPILKTKNMCI